MEDKKEKRPAPIHQGEEFWYKKWWLKLLAFIVFFLIGLLMAIL